MEEVLQKLSVNRSNATSCHSWTTPEEGMRVGEAIGLDRTDLDLANGVITVRQAKFGKAQAAW
jgi:integrase